MNIKTGRYSRNQLHCRTHNTTYGFIPWNSDLNSHLHFDGRMGIVICNLKIFGSEVVDALHRPQDLELGEGADLPLKLQGRSPQDERHDHRRTQTRTHTEHEPT